ncbi:MAG: hypothetical protein V4676_04750 [Bacteroidota bacterium]
MKKSFCFLIIVLLTLPAFTQRPAVSATVDKQTILIGERIQLTLEATVPQAISNNWFAIDSIPHFEIIERSKIDSQAAIAGLILKQTFTITSWDSGRWLIPSLTLLRYKTNPLLINVGHTPMDYTQPYHDIKDILNVTVPRRSNWYWYFVGIAVLIALFMLFFPPKNKEDAKAQPVIEEDVYQASMNRLEKLNVNDEPKYFFTELVDIFRQYVHKRKGIQSFSKTTDDLAIQVKDLSLPVDQYHQLVQTLRLSDGVKFAKFMPTPAEKEEAITSIKKNIITLEQSK